MTSFTNRSLIIATDSNGEVMPVKVDALGNLSVVGAGVASGTQVQLVDGTDTSLKAHIAADGRIFAELTNASVAVTGNWLTDGQLRASALPVSGPLTDAQLRALAVPVSGPLTDVQLRASAVPVSGPLTDAQLRAGAVSVSTGLTPLTDAQHRAVAVPVSGTVEVTNDVGNALPVELGATSLAALETINIIPNRPSEKAGRTAIHRALAAQNTTQDLYTVTVGKTFYMTSLSIFVFNTSTATNGDFRIVDRAGTDTVRIPVLMTSAGVASQLASSAAVGTAYAFVEPKPFTTKVTAVVFAGTLVYSISIAGYEE